METEFPSVPIELSNHEMHSQSFIDILRTISVPRILAPNACSVLEAFKERGFVMLVCAQEQDGLITATSEIHLADVAGDRSIGLGTMYVLFCEIGLALNPYLTPKLDSAQATEAAFAPTPLIVSFVKATRSEVLV